jgi:hypothetical protein
MKEIMVKRHPPGIAWQMGVPPKTIADAASAIRRFFISTSFY